MLDGKTDQEKSRITVPYSPGMTIFSPDGKFDTLQNKVIATIPLGQAPQGVAYAPEAVPTDATICSRWTRSGRPCI